MTSACQPASLLDASYKASAAAACNGPFQWYGADIDETQALPAQPTAKIMRRQGSCTGLLCRKGGPPQWAQHLMSSGHPCRLHSLEHANLLGRASPVQSSGISCWPLLRSQHLHNLQGLEWRQLQGDSPVQGAQDTPMDLATPGPQDGSQLQPVLGPGCGLAGNLHVLLCKAEWLYNVYAFQVCDCVLGAPLSACLCVAVCWVQAQRS